MGEPIKIVDLVKKLIRFAGKVVATENVSHADAIKIYTGLRPGEKLYEELLIAGEVTNTAHPKIMKMNEPALETNQIANFIEELEALIKKRDMDGIKLLLRRMDIGYQPAVSNTINETPGVRGQDSPLGNYRSSKPADIDFSKNKSPRFAPHVWSLVPLVIAIL